MFILPIYAPNISKERLGELLLAQLSDHPHSVTVGQPERRVAFRAPDLEIRLDSDRLDDLLPLFGTLLFIARGLGGSQFQIVFAGFEMRLRSTAIEPPELERLLIACQGYAIEQIEIY